MGIIEQGVNGPFKGKAGSVVGSSWKRIHYIKGLRKDKGRKRPPTPDQAIQREKFVMLNRFFSSLRKVINIGFVQFTGKSTAVNAALRYNYDQAFLDEGGNLLLNYSALKLSHGSLVTAGTEKAVFEGSNAIRVTWNTKTYGMGGEMDDTAHAVAYIPEIDYAAGNVKSEVRQHGSAIINFHEPIDRMTVHVWLFFSDRQSKRVSKTVYIPLNEAGPDSNTKT
ncbi:DUF6266 family protein [Parapedobacter deserti]|uniref:DUF6266 family protein n=1 Tax=Parapedobacter deserti TaxID=1912957 RepID=A0ABV7JFN0_9SPHI